MAWRFLIGFLMALFPLATFWTASVESIVTRSREDGVEGALGVRVAGHLNEIVRLNQQLRLLRIRCPSAIWWPPALAALRAEATYVTIRQSFFKAQAEIDLAMHRGAVTRSPSLRDPPDACGVPGQIRWLRSPIYSHQIALAGVRWDLANGWPVWRYANADVKALP